MLATDDYPPEGATAMAGTLIEILPRTEYDFSKIQGDDSFFWVAQYIDVRQWRSVTLLVRLHSMEIAGTSKVNVGLVSVLPSAEDPSKNFADAENPVVTVEISNELADHQNLLRATGDNQVGAMVSLLLVPNHQGQVGDPLKVTISVALSVKD
jgi:hypothetical protein